MEKSVNDGISKTHYCGQEIKLTYPTIDMLAKHVAELGAGSLLWKRDLKRFFQQIPLCPRDYSLIGYRWQQLLYFDKNMPMGLVSAAYVAQRLTNTISFAHGSLSFWNLNYLDDFAGCEKSENAWSSFNLMGKIIENFGVDEAVEKSVAPTTKMEFLGNTVDTISMTLEVSKHRVVELMNILKNWIHRKSYTKKQLQSLIGKLSFVTNCVRPGRIFISRLLDSLRDMGETQRKQVDKELLLDIQWWVDFLPTCTGTAILWLEDKLPVDGHLATDASLVDGGAMHNQQYFHVKFPEYIINATTNIAQLELLTIVLALKMWSSQLGGKVVQISTDSEISKYAINRGRTKDTFLLKCLREIAWITTKNQILIRAVYLSTKANTIPNALSRWYQSAEARRKFYRLTNRKWKRRSVNTNMFQFISPW